MLILFPPLFFCARLKVLSCAVPEARPQATFAMQTLCKAWVNAISLQGGVSAAIKEGVFALFLHRGCKGTGERRSRTSLQDTQKELPSQIKHEERFSVVGWVFFPSLNVNLHEVWGLGGVGWVFSPRVEG